MRELSVFIDESGDMDAPSRYYILSFLIYRDASPRAFRIAQVADYICGVELVAAKFAAKEASSTDRLFSAKAKALRKIFCGRFARNELGNWSSSLSLPWQIAVLHG